MEHLCYIIDMLKETSKVRQIFGKLIMFGHSFIALGVDSFRLQPSVWPKNCALGCIVYGEVGKGGGENSVKNLNPLPVFRLRWPKEYANFV